MKTSVELDRMGPGSAPFGNDAVPSNGPQNEPQSRNGHEKRSTRWSIQRFRESVGLDGMTMLKMLKGGLPPTIVIAMYQSSAISNITSTAGFISAIMAVASQCLFPRAKFMKIMVYNLLSTCTSAALCCLAITSAVKAREHTTPPGGSLDGYNSSACAVSALWLIFAIWVSNTLRAYKQQELQDPMVAFAIFASITLTHTPQVSSVSDGLAFVNQLLLAFIFGFAIATGVSLFILPITNRRNFFQGTQKYAVTIESVLEAQKAYVKAHIEQQQRKRPEDRENKDLKAAALKSTMISLVGIHDMLHGDLMYAKNELAWGKLTAQNLEGMFSRLRSLLLPLAGISLLPDIFKSLEDEWKRHQKVLDNSKVESDWSAPSDLVYELLTAHDLVVTGLEHSLLVLGIKHSESPKRWFDHFRSDREKDVEASDVSAPGKPGFASHLQEELSKHLDRQQNLLSAFAISEDLDEIPLKSGFEDDEEFFVSLFIQHLFRTLLLAALELVKFADNTSSNGTMKHSRVIFPQGPFIKAWLALGTQNSDNVKAANGGGSGDPTSEPKGPIDPEHLPPSNAWERGGNVLRYISQILASNQSVFGFRAATASFTVAILAFLQQTQEFFTEQRLIWGLIVIAFGMSPTSGAGLFSFAGRILATAVSLVLSLIVWYIVDGNIAGVIVLLYIANVFEYYFYVKYPRILGSCVIGIVTLNVIIGYELQVDQLGIAEAESSGQPIYPVYLFGPYKLLTVIAGCTIAFIWTIFPYPVTSRSQVRKLLGRGLFVLANFYSSMHTTIDIWIEGIQAPSSLADTEKKLFSEEMTLITTMRMFSQFTIYEPPVGGKFPKSTYDNIISEIQSIVISMALMAKIPKSIGDLPTQQEQKWLRQLASVIETTDFNSHNITSVLCHLSAAVSTSTALPPYLFPPEPFPLARKLRTLNDGLFDRMNAQDPAFAAFASLEVLSSMVNKNLAKLISNVKSLVGEVKFDIDIEREPRKNAVVEGNVKKID